MEIFRYWIGASPEAPIAQRQDVERLHEVFRDLDRNAVVEQYGTLGSMILLKVETLEELALDFRMPDTVIAFEHRIQLS
ncbi:MAG: hypothetical protein ACRYG8_21395 [Janthinobacterium lividum]